MNDFKPLPKSKADAQAAASTATLPPAGHDRREKLKARKDTLQQQADAANAQLDAGAGSIQDMPVERELARHFDELSVSAPVPGYVYMWVNFDSPSTSRGLMVRQKLAQRGWEVVCGDMPEAIELRDANGNRRLGDVILMRIKQERFDELEAKEAAKRNMQQRGITSTLEELGQKYQRRGIIVHSGEVDPNIMKRMESGARGAMAARHQLDDNLRAGNIAGLSQ